NVRMLQLLWKGQRCPWASECIPSKLHFFLQNTKKGPGCPLEHTHTHTHTHTQTHTYTHTHTHTHSHVPHQFLSLCPSSCPVVSSSDGTGRSGTYILIDMVLSRMAMRFNTMCVSYVCVCGVSACMLNCVCVC